jgi:hypothetical protein
MKNKLLILILLSFFINSCTIKGNFKGLYSYYENTKKEKQELFINLDVNDSVCVNESKPKDKIYIINGSQLKDCLRKNKKSIVYVWDLKCKSKICYPLELIQSHCNKNNLSLFIIAEYYDAEIMSYKYDINKNILAVDTKYYKSNLVSNYMDKFLKDIDENLYYKNYSIYDISQNK